MVIANCTTLSSPGQNGRKKISQNKYNRVKLSLKIEIDRSNTQHRICLEERGKAFT
jgi:hypothetical protein